MSRNDEARNLLAQEPDRGDRYAKAADILYVTGDKLKHHKTGGVFIIAPRVGEPFPIVVSGRVRWTLELLCERGSSGVTSVENPAPRLAAYVHSLREMGVEIETQNEPHNGDFPGTHGRYFLRSSVTRWVEGGAA